MDRPLDGAVALVTGASQGIGQGIALELGERGALVYLTARNVAGLESTAAQIKELGGDAAPIPCDHADDQQVVAAFDEITRRSARLDLLVNVASPDFTPMVGQPFWALPFHHITDCLTIGPRSNYVTSVLAAPMMIAQGSGLVVNIGSHGAEDFLLATPYGAGKAAIEKVTHDTALELREHGVAVIGLWPGLVLTERIMSQATPTDDGRLELGGLDLAVGESPRFSGRAIVALYTDRERMGRTGHSFFASRLAREYGFTDVDGNLPPELRLLVDYLSDGNVPLYWQFVERFGRGFLRRPFVSNARAPLLEAANLDFSYGHVQVLFDVSLDIHDGEVLALLGTNGAGKSTLLRVISGLARPDRGTVRLAGEDITDASPGERVRRGIVQICGGRAIFGALTVADNLRAGAYSYKWERERIRDRSEIVLGLFPALAPRLDQLAGSLSGGEQQMLAIAKALMLDPRVLIIDELSLGLAPVVVQQLLGIVERLTRAGITMVIVEQSVNVALALAKRAVFMEKGAVRFTGPASDLLERNDLVRAVFLGSVPA